MNKPKLFVLLENVRSAYNVGSVFRTCDSAGVDKLFLIGYTAHPPHHKLQKTALGATQSVVWEHHCHAVKLCHYLKKCHIYLVAMETTKEASSLFNFSIHQNTCLVFGHEETGISQEVLSIVDEVIKIPHFGIKDSLNIATAAGVAVYECKRQLIKY